MRIAHSALMALLVMGAAPSVGVAQVLTLDQLGYHWSLDHAVPVATVSLAGDIVALDGARTVQDSYGEPFVLGAATLDVTSDRQDRLQDDECHDGPIPLKDVLFYERTMVSRRIFRGATISAPTPTSAAAIRGVYPPAGEELQSGATLTVDPHPASNVTRTDAGPPGLLCLSVEDCLATRRWIRPAARGSGRTLFESVFMLGLRRGSKEPHRKNTGVVRRAVLRSPTIAACLLSILLSAASAAQAAVRRARARRDHLLVLVDDLHMDFRNTGHIRELLRSLSTGLIRDDDVVVMRSSGPSSIAIGPTSDRAIVDAAIRRVAGNGLRPEEISEELKNSGDLDVRLAMTFSAASSLLDTVTSTERRRDMLDISDGYDSDRGCALGTLLGRAAKEAH